jgi:hypothetical protein
MFSVNAKLLTQSCEGEMLTFWLGSVAEGVVHDPVYPIEPELKPEI